MKVHKEKWTVQVQGDMTLMNKDEAAKLNEKFRKRKKDKFGSHLETPPERATISHLPAPLPVPVGSRKTGSLPPVIENEKEADRPNWVDQISSEFSVKLSEVSGETSNRQSGRKALIPVSPAPKKRKASKGDINISK